MAISFQYNKTYLQQLNRELKVRLNALPTLQAKESALRFEVKKAREEMAALTAKLQDVKNGLSNTYRMWSEFPADLVEVSGVNYDLQKVAGVKIPLLRSVSFTIRPFSIFASPAWFNDGIAILRSIARLQIQLQLARRKVEILEFARKKTTQKVNLYEKVQIPAYNEAILKIKRFMEDEDNLAKSSQKILKARMALAETVGGGA